MRSEGIIPGTTSNCRIVDVGIDWITLTSPRESELHDVLLNNWYEVFNRIRLVNGLLDDASVLGYAGIKTDGAFVGTRYDGAMIRLTGRIAREHFLSLKYETANCTRIDVQVTCEWTGTGAHPPRLVAMHANASNELLPKSRQRNIEERKDNREGYTTYVGSRQSSSFLRCYHKSAEDPDAYGPNVYRYEVQYNKDTAYRVLETLQQHQETLESACVALVWDWCERRGIIPVFKHSAEKVIVSRETLPLTELDKKLSWLITQVRPTVGTLVEQGYRKEAIIALLGTDLGKEVQHFLENHIMQRLDERTRTDASSNPHTSGTV